MFPMKEEQTRFQIPFVMCQHDGAERIKDLVFGKRKSQRGGFSNQTDDSYSDDGDAILADLKEKWKTVEGNGRITDDSILSDILEGDAELLTASYPTDEEILKSLMENNKGQENDSYSENEDVMQPKPHRPKCYNHSKPLKEVSKWKKMCPTLFLAHS
ncbi:hypothetical protein AVEN_9178-1 [Araneus ventricosus]|uniref:Uncharacterized protein n=1 Tax=Araneus ventricosus TaxID=182803 RepID=A0A4Y2A0K6_ARAVE|nr:hypothetical protein AVEN_9178-1 [Araneus ventricosus]